MRLLSIICATTFILEVALANDDDKFITCGSAVKLKHVQSGEKFYLDSGEVTSQRGSGQQMVTLKPSNDSHSSLWLVREAYDPEHTVPCVTATPVKCNSIIRLTHVQSNKNLHSHSYKSALASKQEVTCFGEGGNGDASDNFEVICRGKFWEKDVEIMFQHVETKKYLAASNKVAFNERNCGGNCPIKNHLEAFAIASMDQHVAFKADLGIFLSR